MGGHTTSYALVGLNCATYKLLFINQEVHVDAWLFLDWSDAFHFHSRVIFVDTG